MDAAQGDSLLSDGTVAGVTAYEDILLQITVEAETATALTVGQHVTYTVGADLMETPHMGCVSEIFALEEEDAYIVRIAPDAPEARVGMSVEVTLDIP